MMRYFSAAVSVSVLLLAFAASDAAAATTWLVPGNGSNTCTIVSPNCNTIAQAVTASASGDTISIAAGTFAVPAVIVLTKTLTIEGAGNTNTFVQPAAGVTAFSVRTSNIVLRDFTIQNGGIGVAFQSASSTNTQITRVTFSGQTSRGIEISLSASFTVDNVAITDCRIATANIGLRMASTSQVTNLSITNTTFDSNLYGIYQANDGSSSKLTGFTISNGTFTNNTNYSIYAEEMRDAVIEDSSFSGGTTAIGLLKFYSSNGVPMSNIAFSRNDFAGFTGNALDIEMNALGLGSPITIEDNTITKDVGIQTSSPAVFVRLHPTLTNGAVNILNNDITLTGTFGAGTAAHAIQLRGNGPVVITGNVLEGGNVGGSGTTPPSSGIFIQSKSGSTTMPATTVISGSCNRIQGFHNGVSVFDSVGAVYGGLPAGATVSFADNAIVDNDNAGVANGASPVLDFQSNWWGCSAGPGNAGCDGIIGGVDAASPDAAPPACVTCLDDADCDDDLFCNGAETCNGSNQCVPASDPCAGGPACGNVCNEAADDCIVPNGVPCRPSDGPCDVVESCDGVSTTCPADGFEPASSICRPSVDDCDADDYCPGDAAACSSDDKVDSGTACTSDGNPCSLDQCNGVSDLCQHPAGNAGATCRVSSGVCDIAESCDGASTTCPADGFEPASTVCRPSVDECDADDYCPGGAAACSSDDKVDTGTACTSDGNPCSLDQCDGVSDLCQHPAGNAGATCRVSSGVCDAAESCDGASTSCPADGFAPASTECRAASGECDAAESCTGSSAACPADEPLPDGAPCTDGVTCTIDDVCTAGVCGGDSMTCGDGVIQGGCGEACDDGNLVSGDGCSQTCGLELCGATPVPDCEVAAQAQLQSSEKTPGKERLKLQWKRVEGATTQDAFGDPVTGTTRVGLCLYGDDDVLIRGFVVDQAGQLCAGKPCWKAKGTKGYGYKDKAAASDGIAKISYGAGDPGKGKAGASGANNSAKGQSSLPTGLVGMLSGNLNPTIQLVTSDGLCIGSTMTEVTRDDSAQYRARKK